MSRASGRARRWLCAFALVCGAEGCLVDNPGFSAGAAESGSEVGSGADADAGAAATSVGSTGAVDTSVGSGTQGVGESEGSTTGASGEATGASTSAGETSAGTTSAGATSEATGEGTTEAPERGPPSLCSIPFGQWQVGAAELVLPELQVGHYDPALLPDGVTLFYSAKGESYRVLRAGFGSPFVGPPALNEDINTIDDESKVMVSADGLRAYIASDRPPAAAVDIFVASRLSEGEAFQQPAHWLVELSTPENELDVHISADELRVYFARRVGSDMDLYFGSRPALDAPFAGVAPMVELNLPEGPEASPSLSADERTIFFTSRRGQDVDLNIYAATREDPAGPFDAPQQVAGLAGPGIQAEPFLVERPEGCELFFAQNTQDGVTWRIYRAPIVVK